MLRPGGFPEWTPSQQRIRDKMIDIVTNVFRNHGYQHIWTPAVEAIDVLKKGGDVIDQQVYGLYGLAQGSSDTKDYALHFDLTVPLARYILDHQQDIVFPFSRYQIQPVWRGESHKRGRYKEFRQCDIDTIWRSSSDVGQRYDVQSIIVMESAMKAVCKYFDIDINFVVKINHLSLTKTWLSSIDIQGDIQKQVLKLLDGYFKLGHEKCVTLLSALVADSNLQLIINLIQTKNYTVMKGLPAYDELVTIIDLLDTAGVHYEYDLCIVRGQNYYSGMVCERMDSDDIALGSLAAGGRYDNLTTFLDPKQSFSGVGTSLGRFTSLIMEKHQEKQIVGGVIPNSYLFAHLGTINQCLVLSKLSYFQDCMIEFYPTPVKLGKQFEFAEKKGIQSIVLYGEDEIKQGIFIIKNLTTGVEEILSVH